LNTQVNDLLLKEGRATVSRHWARDYFENPYYMHPKISFKKSKNLETCRILGSNIEAMQEYVERLRAAYAAHTYHEDLIINYDETWVNPHKPGKSQLVAVSELIDKEAYVEYSDKEMEHITIGSAITAYGTILPHQVIVPRQSLPEQFLDSSLTRWRYDFVYAKSGWATKVFK